MTTELGGDGWRSRKLWLSIGLYSAGIALGEVNLAQQWIKEDAWLWLQGGLTAMVLIVYGVLNVAELVTLVRGRAVGGKGAP